MAMCLDPYRTHQCPSRGVHDSHPITSPEDGAFACRITIQDGADIVRDVVRQLVSQGRVKLVLNFHDVAYIDSIALGEIIGAYTSVTCKGGTLKLLNVTARVHELLVITRLLSVFDLFDVEAEALRSFGDAGIE